MKARWSSAQRGQVLIDTLLRPQFVQYSHRRPSGHWGHPWPGFQHWKQTCAGASTSGSNGTGGRLPMTVPCDISRVFFSRPACAISNGSSQRPIFLNTSSCPRFGSPIPLVPFSSDIRRTAVSANFPVSLALDSSFHSRGTGSTLESLSESVLVASRLLLRVICSSSTSSPFKGTSGGPTTRSST